MIRHALATPACPVGSVPVAVIVPSLRAFLVFPLGGPRLLAARFAPAAETAVFVAPVTMTADPEHPATVDPPAKPLTQWFLMGPHGGVFGGPEQPRQSLASGILSTEDGRLVSSARRKNLDRPRPTSASALMTTQSRTIGAHRNAVASMAPCLCIGPLPLMGVFTESLEAWSGPRTTPWAARPAADPPACRRPGTRRSETGGPARTRHRGSGPPPDASPSPWPRLPASDPRGGRRSSPSGPPWASAQVRWSQAGLIA